MCDESDKSQLKITLDYDKSSKSVTYLFIQEHVVGRLYFLKNCSNLTRANLEKNMGLCSTLTSNVNLYLQNGGRKQR